MTIGSVRRCLKDRLQLSYPERRRVCSVFAGDAKMNGEQKGQQGDPLDKIAIFCTDYPTPARQDCGARHLGRRRERVFHQLGNLICAKSLVFVLLRIHKHCTHVLTHSISCSKALEAQKPTDIISYGTFGTFENPETLLRYVFTQDITLTKRYWYHTGRLVKTPQAPFGFWNDLTRDRPKRTFAVGMMYLV